MDADDRTLPSPRFDVMVSPPIQGGPVRLKRILATPCFGMQAAPRPSVLRPVVPGSPAVQRSNSFLIEYSVTARPALAIDVVSGISLGHTATQF